MNSHSHTLSLSLIPDVEALESHYVWIYRRHQHGDLSLSLSGGIESHQVNSNEIPEIHRRVVYCDHGVFLHLQLLRSAG